MELPDYINLMSNSRDSALNLWGFLLTASIAVIGYLGSTQNPTRGKSVFFGFLFFAFAASNFNALKINYDSRAAMTAVMEERSESDPKFRSDYKLNEALISEFELRDSALNLTFQVVISLAVIGMILTHEKWARKIRRG